VLLAFCAYFAGRCALSQTQKPADLAPPGQIVDVTCSSDATQSYALYLPSTYTPAKRWPVIYFFDPGGRGRRALELYKDIAETYGFILAGSNNSRNFSNEQGKAVNAVWQDTHARFGIDERRSYASGFSGGARVAGAMALSGRHRPSRRRDRARRRLSQQQDIEG
jgi:poly(3-hydroxybutyrate) depolymerase